MGTRNTLGDLNNHLFEQMERLNNDDLTTDELETEMNRTKGMVSISKNIIDNAKTVLDAKKHMDEYHGMKENADMPRMLEGND